MKPETLQALKENAHFKEVCAYLTAKLDELDRLPDEIPTNAGDEWLGHEVRARFLAHSKLEEILTELMSAQLSTPHDGFKKEEYNVY